MLCKKKKKKSLRAVIGPRAPLWTPSNLNKVSHKADVKWPWPTSAEVCADLVEFIIDTGDAFWWRKSLNNRWTPGCFHQEGSSWFCLWGGETAHGHGAETSTPSTRTRIFILYGLCLCLSLIKKLTFLVLFRNHCWQMTAATTCHSLTLCPVVEEKAWDLHISINPRPWYSRGESNRGSLMVSQWMDG